MRMATSFPPYSLIVRVMVQAEKDEDALEGLRQVYMPLKKLYEERGDKFIFFNKMRSPIKKIQGKFRYQVLLRLLDKELLPEIYAVCDDVLDKSVSVFVEENPASLS